MNDATFVETKPSILDNIQDWKIFEDEKKF